MAKSFMATIKELLGDHSRPNILTGLSGPARGPENFGPARPGPA
jgi:hypothetical protein